MSHHPVQGQVSPVAITALKLWILREVVSVAGHLASQAFNPDSVAVRLLRPHVDDRVGYEVIAAEASEVDSSPLRVCVVEPDASGDAGVSPLLARSHLLQKQDFSAGISRFDGCCATCRPHPNHDHIGDRVPVRRLDLGHLSPRFAMSSGCRDTTRPPIRTFVQDGTPELEFSQG